jgi:hypothetical protein
MKPNLFLVGFQKCGSSSLFDYLVHHTDIQGSSKKETFCMTDKTYEHFDWTKSVLNPKFNWDVYFDFSQKKKYFLEGSVCNFYQQTAKDYISEIDGAKVIFLIRNPIERFISAFNYYGRDGIYVKPGTSIEEFYDISVNKLSDKEGVNFALEHGQYLRYILEWKELISDEAVLVLGLKEISLNPMDVAEKLSNFLEIKNSFPTAMSYKNKSLVVKNKTLHLALRKIAKAVGLKSKWLKSQYRSVILKTPDKIVLQKDLKEKLISFYSEEFKYLSSYF